VYDCCSSSHARVFVELLFSSFLQAAGRNVTIHGIEADPLAALVQYMLAMKTKYALFELSILIGS
jgi:hypothetical protein